jgi:CheY-like chemotaxis protein/DNA-directed RNA polymerase specialized sigma24 family protein
MTMPRRDDVIQALPYARRYARALTGSQKAGDSLVGDCLRALPVRQDEIPPALTQARHILYWGVTALFDRLPALASPAEGLSAQHRQLLLLTALEDVAPEDAAPIIGLSLDAAQDRLTQAREQLRAAAATDVLIIEDEPIIAMDLEELVQSCGHRVVGLAASETDAIEIARRTRPGLILADINLGLGGDGTNAVSTILESHYAPVIFVTAYPERLLTGDTLEPAFVITKPFEPLTLAIATYQAVTGGVQLDKV